MFSFIHANESASRIQMFWPTVWFIFCLRRENLRFHSKEVAAQNFMSILMSSSVEDTMSLNL